MDWEVIIGVVIAILGLVFGGAFYLKWKQLSGLFREISEAFLKTSEAMEDGKITGKEAQELLKEWMDIYRCILTDFIARK